MISVIVPARNEEQAITGTLEAIRKAGSAIGDQNLEILAVDNVSTDRTAERIKAFADVRYIRCDRVKASCARNCGAGLARGSVLVFVDADTAIPEDGLIRVRELAEKYDVGLFRINGEGGDWRSRCWWWFLNELRRLPIAQVKALPGFMFCTREAFECYGPFDEDVVLLEEWPITAGCYRRAPDRLVYDRSLTAFTSDRRMERPFLGYTRTFFRYTWALFHRSGRFHYTDRIR